MKEAGGRKDEGEVISILLGRNGHFNSMSQSMQRRADRSERQSKYCSMAVTVIILSVSILVSVISHSAKQLLTELCCLDKVNQLTSFDN